MQMNTPSWSTRSTRSTTRLTPRGRIALIATGAVVAGAAVAVPLLTLGGEETVRPTSLVIPEGRRASQVYEAVDQALALPAGTTEKSLGKARLKLPADAEGNPEGYLFPATYPLDDKATPEKLLRAMVHRANRE
ncbi:endolytic transglycosylase MltG, partial [Streptomyces sp. TRM76130]|nr:endolytic transglycosylase MltG [Streptomyces sp. TRM76130]